ncbi:acetolactate synthase large subunit [Bacillus sp. JJ1764]|uniref:acetolactate synthase large subunit n=1 Tax=Bacillus sp. JJ1764 TaxID=3122964 RepID=UPI002FFE0F23
MKASDLMVKCLENEGVEFIFGIIGSEVLDLADSLSSSEKIRYIPVRHEQGAAFMADIYGRLTGKTGVCLATLGPGAANLLTGIASANLDHSPVVALAGQKGLETHHKQAHQFVDMVRVFGPATKWAIQIKDGNTIPEIIRQSFRKAYEEKPGAVYVEFPENIAAEAVTSQPLRVSDITNCVPNASSVNTVLQLLQESQRPFIIVGNQVIRQDAVQEVQEFAAKLGCPLATSFMAKGILPKEHPQNYYCFGFKEKDYVVRGFEESDLLIAIGLDLVEAGPSAWNQKKVPVIHIGACCAEVDDHYQVRSELVGNIKESLKMLDSKEISAKQWQPSGDLKKRMEESYSIVENRSSRFTIEAILHVIEKVQTEDTLIISDVGSHKVAIARTYQPMHAKQLIISNGLASMGISIPGAIGAKLAAPEKTVIVVTGDGGALMNFAELETAKRLGLPFIVIVLNDSMLKLEVDQMKQKFGESYGVTFSNPNFVQLAESFGVKGVKPRDLNEFEAMLVSAKKGNEFVLMEVMVENRGP